MLKSKENPEGMKPSGYKMTYKNSAFPFKSPVKNKKGKQHSHVDSGGRYHTQAEYEKASEKFFDPKVVALAKSQR